LYTDIIGVRRRARIIESHGIIHDRTILANGWSGDFRERECWLPDIDTEGARSRGRRVGEDTVVRIIRPCNSIPDYTIGSIEYDCLKYTRTGISIDDRTE
jgi:hypothetical protein